MSLIAARTRISSGLLDAANHGAILLAVIIWDLVLALYNAATPSRPKGELIPPLVPGHAQLWPPFRAPLSTDSRSPCPALNAMANHGILPRDGRNIRFTDLKQSIRETFNFAPTFCYFVPLFAARMLCRDYATGTLDLSDLAVHNGIEHDASLTRYDTYHAPDQSVPAADLVDELLSQCTGAGGTELTVKDLARVSARRRADAQATNPQFTLSLFHKMFGSSNSATMLAVLGPKKEDLISFLKEERIPRDYEPPCLERMGLTIAQFNKYVLSVELAIPGVKSALDSRKAKGQ